jgi:hypothetical protein
MHHLGVEARVRGEQAVEDAAMRVRPIHHGGDGEAEFTRRDSGFQHRRIVNGSCWWVLLDELDAAPRIGS